MRTIIVIPASSLAAAITAVTPLQPSRPDLVWNVPLNATGRRGDAASHYWCCWNLTAAQVAQLQAAAIPGATFTDRDAKAPDTLLGERALKAMESNVVTRA